MTLIKTQRRRRRRTALTLLCLSLLVAASYVVLLGLGPLRLSPAQVVEILNGGGHSQAIAVVWDLRMPVALASVIAGAGLGMAGAWTQTTSRNPLASPDILGVSGGAAVLVVLGTVTFRPEWSQELPTTWWRAGLALAGAFIIIVLLIVLGGIGTSRRVVIIGFSLSMACHSLVSYLILKAEIMRAAEAQTWLVGSTGFVRMDMIAPLLIGMAPFLILGLCFNRDLALLAHDDASAHSLGVHTQRCRSALLIAATGVVAVIVACVGPIGFIALMAPHLARLCTKSPTPQPLVSAAMGALLLTGCSILSALMSVTVPVGAITAVVGGTALVLVIWHLTSKENA